MSAHSRGPGPALIVGRLVYPPAATEALGAAATTAEARDLLRRGHDHVMEAILPALTRLKSEGLVVDFASSWKLAELVVHAVPQHRTRVLEALQALPQLTEVNANALAARQRLRRR